MILVDFWLGSEPEPYILGELRDNMAYVGFKEELSMVHGTLHIFLGIKLFCLSR